jgi:hypothetical protein
MFRCEMLKIRIIKYTEEHNNFLGSWSIMDDCNVKLTVKCIREVVVQYFR